VRGTVTNMAAQIASVSPLNLPSPGRRVRVGINMLEATIDNALADGGRLMAEMLKAGQEVGVLPQVSQRAIERMHECLKAGIEMRAQVIATHHDLRKIMTKVDFQALGYGDESDCPGSGG